jgi:hypothetical protein
MGRTRSAPVIAAAVIDDDAGSGIWRAALLYVALTLLLAYPLSVDPGRRVLSSGPDTTLFMWTLSWDAHAFVRRPLSIFEANIYYPEPDTLAYSENLIGSAVLVAPVLWLTGNPALAMNLVALLSCVLCGLGVYVLARRVGIGAAGAALGGIIFAFSPPRFFRLSQLHLATIEWVPFGLAFLHGYLDTGRKRDLRAAAACFSLQALSSGHGAVFLTIAAVGLMLHRVACGEPAAIVRRVRDLGLSGALLLTPAILVAFPYRRVQVAMGLRRTLDDWAINWGSFLASPAHLPTFLLSLVSHADVNDHAGAYLFPGYLPLILAAAAVLLWRRPAPDNNASPRGATTAFYGLLTLVSVWLSVGPPVGLWPLVYWWPGMNFIRVPSRFTLLALMGLAVLAGIGFDRLSANLPSKRRVLLATAIGVALVFELAAFPLQTEPYHLDIPAIDRWLDTQPKPFAIAEVPLANPRNLGAAERRQTTYMIHAMAHWQKTVHGYSGLRPPLHTALYTTLLSFPDEKSLNALRALGVRYVVVHTDFYGRDEWRMVDTRIAQLPQRLRLEHVEGPGRVYSIAP